MEVGIIPLIAVMKIHELFIYNFFVSFKNTLKIHESINFNKIIYNTNVL